MRRTFPWLLVGTLLTLVGCGDDGTVTPDSGPPGDARPIDSGFRADDEDGDGISDFNEGRDDLVDTDADGTPDYLDLDSDGDGIPDATEGAGDPTIPPPDSDADGTPDFRDLDSDDNGIPDAIEGASDTDGDGIGDFADLDNDGDSIRDDDEIGPDPSMPEDFDGDGVPDYLDIDSDGDTIHDRHEAIPEDTDMDGIPDRHDADTDGDGISDADEAGDADVMTPPVDSDGDMIPDFRDTDSDNDGLSDRDETTLGTDPTNPDTDGDGVSDLIEVAACAGDPACEGDVLDPDSSPRTRGDFVFLEPYMEPPDPPRDTLVFSTDIQVADVYFMTDTTGSMGGAITNVRTSLSTPGTGIIDQVRSEIPDVWFGVGGFDDYPAGSYGSGGSCGDRAYYHFQDLTMSSTDAQAAVNMYRTHCGADGPESLFPALYAVSTGMGLPGSSGWTGNRADGYGGFAACPAGFIGWPCFRPGAVPIVVAITDVYQHNGPTGGYAYSDATIGAHAPTYAEALAALVDARIRVIGVAVGTLARTDLETVATDTGAVDGTGAPLVSIASAGSVSAAVVDQIRILANQTPIDISLVYEDDASDTVDTWAAFMDHIEANETGDAALGCEPRMGEDTDGDGFPDTFLGVTPGSPVCFDIVVKQNDTVMFTTMPQLFRATLRVLGDGFTELDARDIYFLVPPHIEPPGGPD